LSAGGRGECRYKKLYSCWGWFLTLRLWHVNVVGMSNLYQMTSGAAVRIVMAGTAFFLTMLVFSVTLSCASEAQAALTGRMPVYEIPAKLNPEERRWFKVFQEGNFLSDGWQEISAEILAKTPAAQRQAQRAALENLGNKIGMEWSRPNAIRKVDSAMLQEWGDILRRTARTNPLQLAKAIASIDQKVDAVLD
jgi:hypothetical protein